MNMKENGVGALDYSKKENGEKIIIQSYYYNLKRFQGCLYVKKATGIKRKTAIHCINRLKEKEHMTFLIES